MNLIKGIIISFCFIIILSISAKASHIVGGEMSYTCTGNNNYNFILKVYRDCSPGTAELDQKAIITVYKESDNSVYNTLNFVPLADSSYLTFSPTNPCLVVPPNVCIEQGVYTFSLNLPPGNGGYIVAYQRCCRNAAVININSPTTTGSTYFDAISDTTLALCNTSPTFKNYPPIILCENEPFSFDHSAFDADGDSLTYELCQPYTSESTPATGTTPPPFTPISYIGSYTFDNPMNTSPPLAINPKTGLLTCTPSDIGRFAVGICVSEYRKGVFLGEYLRDFQFIVVSCKPTVVASIPADSNDCRGDTIHFQNFSSSNSTYHWDFGIDSLTNDTSDLQYPTYVYPHPGTYTTTLVVDKAGTTCGDTATSFVKINPMPRAGDDTTIVYGTSGIIFARGGVKYVWSPSYALDSINSANPVASPTITTTYTVTITTIDGCVVDIPVIVKVTRTPIVTFYNAFSPNGNGKNDYFHPITIGALNDVSFRIYNRWGQEVYESQDATAVGWDGKFKGKPQPVGVYEYYFECVGAQDNQKFTYKGNVTLLR